MNINLNTSYYSFACVHLDYICDFIPFLSTVTNLTNLFLKNVYYPRAGTSYEENHYYAHLYTKQNTLLKTIPIVGNVVHLWTQIVRMRYTSLYANANDPGEKVIYEMTATEYGNPDLSLIRGQAYLENPDRPALRFGNVEVLLLPDSTPYLLYAKVWGKNS